MIQDKLARMAMLQYTTEVRGVAGKEVRGVAGREVRGVAGTEGCVWQAQW